MSSLRIAIALMTSIICMSTASAVDIELAGGARNPGVERWIRYQIVGPRNHPLPIVYLSTRTFKTMADERLIVLPPKRYDIISAHARARVALADCPGEMPRGDVWYSVEIAVHGEKHAARCVLPQASACNYLTDLLKLPGIDLTATERRPIANFMEEAGCDGAGANGAK